MKQNFLLRAAILLTPVALLFSAACNQKNTPVSEQKNAETSSADSNVSVSADTGKNSQTSTTPISTDAESVAGISGKIILKGTPPPERDLPLTPDCGRLHTTIPKTRIYVVGENGALADVFVYIKEGLNGKTFAPPSEPVLLDQVGCEYTPYVLGLQTGQKLLVRNSDPMMHNVHAMPIVAGNRESNKAQMAKSPDLQYTFDTPELFLRFKCDVHPWMYAYVSVVDNPFFAVSGKDGTFHLKNVPDGKYVVEAVHRKAGKLTREVSVANGKSEPIDFTFEIPASL